MAVKSANPSDLVILEAIYHKYFDQFIDQSESGSSREKVYVAVDVRQVAEELRMNKHLLFGRLYYHLDFKYRYKNDDNSWVHLFAPLVGDAKHCIHFPYLAAVVSERQKEVNRILIPLMISLTGLVVSIVLPITLELLFK